MTTVREFADIQSGSGGKCSTQGLVGLDNQIAALLFPVVSDELVLLDDDIVQIVGSSTIPRLQPAARRALERAVEEQGEKVQLVHAYRTVAQQFVLFHWFQHGRCRIKLAASPGTSPHEKGIAIDIQEHARWRPVLEKHGWRWRGSADPPHFNFVGPGIGTRILTEGIRAFQRLWNLHNPDDHIKEDGLFGEKETAPRLLRAPVEGF